MKLVQIFNASNAVPLLSPFLTHQFLFEHNFLVLWCNNFLLLNFHWLTNNGTRKFCSGDWLRSVTNEEFSALASSFQTVMWFGSEVKWGKFYDFILCQMTSRKFGDIKSFGGASPLRSCEHRSARRPKVLPDAYKDAGERESDRQRREHHAIA